MLAVCLLGLPQVAAAQAARETDVEAAYLFNFGRFMHVPAPASREFRIGILGQDPFGGTLQKLTLNEAVDGRKMRVVLLATPEEARQCDIVFLGESESVRLEHDLAVLDRAPVLTVSRISGFVEHGGMIQFVVQQSRVRFQVNLAAASRAHVQLSSELLKVAVQVTNEPARKGPAA